ncbi:GGDEF domain-containing protein [Pedomonas mirosovicensis]|uniref:GGDEF domain-containing protein n=1 Tax=Pedomonas mirosovicensis TaxID=2908641 RepID=UPI002168383D|nr:GGDEF domain-containing protein [Pedomonas mirosovicensis]MCH8684026.1 GGDEF domain-containing protein [Pedomonas mirosovicensis]
MPTLSAAIIAPGVLTVFGLAFLWAWSIERKRHYLLLLAGACLCFCIGSLSQVFGLPPGTGPNSLFSGLFHTLAVLLTAEGVLTRSGKRLGRGVFAGVLVGMVGLLGCFAYVWPNLLARIYLQNFGYGAILLMTALKLRPLARGRRVDRALFWFMLIFAAQFFPRTVLTLGLRTFTSVQEFASSPFWQVLQFSLAIFGSGLGFTILAAALTDVMDDLRRERDTDPLTGVFNRRGFLDKAGAALRHGRSAPMTLVACDLDHFKSINDTFGHEAGDEVLRTFGALLRDTARGTDIIGRTGGEEFLVLLPGTARAGAFELCERVRQRLEGWRFPPLGGARTVTASFGIAEREGSESLQALMRKADRRLYAAKAAGRNCTVAVDKVELKCLPGKQAIG